MSLALVEERLAACVNIMPGVRSVYRWEGEVQTDDEVLMVVKAAADAFARLDLSVAAKVVRQDEQVDESFRAILRQFITVMMEDPRTISNAIDILFIAKAWGLCLLQKKSPAIMLPVPL